MIRRQYTISLFLLLLLISVPPALAAPPEAARPKILIGGDHNNPPYEYLANGKPTGFSVELIQAVADVEGLTAEIQLAPWVIVRQNLEEGKIDAVAGMYYSPERNRLVDFSVPHTLVTSGIFVRRDSDIHSFDDIRGKEIIVQKGDILHDFLLSRHISTHIIPVTNTVDELRLLASGKHDCAFMYSRLQGEYLIKKEGISNVRVVSSDQPPLQYCFAVRKGDRELVHRLNEGLNILKANGRYRQIYDKWFGVYERRRLTNILIYLVPPLVLFVALSVAGLLWSRSLRNKVKQRTAELEAKTESLEAIHSIADKLYRSLDLQTVADHAVQAMMLRSNSPSVAIFLMDEEGLHLEMISSRGFTEQLLGEARSLPVRGSLSGVAIDEHRVVICQDVAEDARVEPAVRDALLENGYHGAVSVPLLAEEKVLGVLNLLYHDCRMLPPTLEKELLVIGQTVGLAISHAVNVAHLREEMAVRRRAEEELQRLNAELENRVLRRTSELAEAKERAEEADRLKSAFLATMSHELRTPLNSIIGFTGILHQEMAGPLNEEQKKQMGMVRNSASHLLELINDVLDLSKIEAGQLTLSFQSFDLRESIEKAARSLHPLVEAKGLDLRIDISTEVGTIVSDRRRVEQVLLNLLSNAIKFTDHGEIHVDCRMAQDRAHISVADSGIGIRNEEVDNLFKPFRQLESGLNRRFEGTGLGLYICKKLVECLGGEIGVASVEGKGSTFSFALPLNG